EGRMAGRARFRGGATVDAAMLVALSDVWPPAALVTFDRPRQVVTVDWRTDLLDVPAAPPDAWWTWESRTTAGADGYLVQDGWMWGPDGDLVLHGRQMLAVVG
ncbi:MAG TPA: thioesterase family protein, partial [Myxococcota bacterium]|nr:thioesterase family protein [Myxococcota bacterium]